MASDRMLHGRVPLGCALLGCVAMMASRVRLLSVAVAVLASQGSCFRSMVLARIGDADADPTVSESDTRADSEEADSTWVELGLSGRGTGVSAHGAQVECKVLAVDGLGRPAVAWADTSTGAWGIYFARFDGTAWVGLGDSLVGQGLARGSVLPDASGNVPCMGGIAFDAADQPTVVWKDYRDGMTRIYLLRWNGTTWHELSGSASGSGLSPETEQSWWPTIAIYEDQPVVAWEAYLAPDSAIYAKRWNGSAWTELDGSATGRGISQTSANAEQPVVVRFETPPKLGVAWRDNRSGSYQAYVRAWDGTGWRELGGSDTASGVSQSAASIRRPHLGGHVSSPLVLQWEQDGTRTDVCVRGYARDGQGWESFGVSPCIGVALEDERSRHQASVALDERGLPVVVWAEEVEGGGSEVFGMRFDGAQWIDLAPEAAPLGISATPTDSIWPSVAVDTRGVLIVAWEEEIGPGVRELYLKARR